MLSIYYPLMPLVILQNQILPDDFESEKLLIAICPFLCYIYNKEISDDGSFMS